MTGKSVKKIIFVILALMAPVAGKAETQFESFEGKWLYERADKSMGGSLVIKNCDENTCDFDIYTRNGAQTCRVDGKMKIVSPRNGQYHNRERVLRKPIDIMFALNPTGTIEVKCDGDCMYYCGARASFQGQYENEKLPITYKVSGFDCKKAATDVEKLICHDKLLSYADNELNRLYKNVTGQKDAQKVWLTTRDACGKNTECLYKAYEKRIRELVTLIKNEFSYENYVDSIRDDRYFVATDSFLLLRMLTQKLGVDVASGIQDTMSNPFVNKCDNCKFVTGGVLGLNNIMEAALYIKGDNIFIAVLNVIEITVYHTKGVDTPKEIKEWLGNLNERIKSKNEAKYEAVL